MTTPRTPAPSPDLRPLVLARLDALGDEAAALGLAVAAHPGPIPTRALQHLPSAADAARAVLFEVRREIPGQAGRPWRGSCCVKLGNTWASCPRTICPKKRNHPRPKTGVMTPARPGFGGLSAVSRSPA
jgi:hypothetical protein